MTYVGLIYPDIGFDTVSRSRRGDAGRWRCYAGSNDVPAKSVKELVATPRPTRQGHLRIRSASPQIVANRSSSPRARAHQRALKAASRCASISRRTHPHNFAPVSNALPRSDGKCRDRVTSAARVRNCRTCDLRAGFRMSVSIPRSGRRSWRRPARRLARQQLKPSQRGAALGRSAGDIQTALQAEISTPEELGKIIAAQAARWPRSSRRRGEGAVR